MALPSSGSVSIAQVAAELGLSLPLDLNDSRVRALAGKPTGNVTLPNDFWGKSNAPTLSISGGISQEWAGSGRSRDVANLTLNWTGNTVPSSYSWSWGGYSVMVSGASTRTATFQGQSYNAMNFNPTDDAVAVCAAVVGGQTYYAEISLSFQVDGGSGGGI